MNMKQMKRPKQPQFSMNNMLNEIGNIGNDNMKDDNRTSNTPNEKDNISDDNNNGISKMKTSSFRFTTIGRYRKKTFFGNGMRSIRKPIFLRDLKMMHSRPYYYGI